MSNARGLLTFRARPLLTSSARMTSKHVATEWLLRASFLVACLCILLRTLVVFPSWAVLLSCSCTASLMRWHALLPLWSPLLEVLTWPPFVPGMLRPLHVLCPLLIGVCTAPVGPCCRQRFCSAMTSRDPHAPKCAKVCSGHVCVRNGVLCFCLCGFLAT